MSTIMQQMSQHDHEQVVFCNDSDSGLKAIIAIHNTALGPSLGGCRFYNYQSEDDALFDVLRLSRGMSYKAAVANLNLGGGKSVIIGDPKKIKSEKLFRAFGRFVDGLKGRYITAEDVGTNLECMEWIYQETKHVVGIPTYFGGSGDPSPVTAQGTFVGIKASLKKAKGNDNLAGVKIAVQGAAGHVGYPLCQKLYNSGAKLYVSDTNEEGLKKLANEMKAEIVGLDNIYGLDVDVYSPCALGATVNDKTISQLKCSIIAGSANNQLLDVEKHGAELKKRGILYAPDYVINAGGLINASSEVFGGGTDHAWTKTEEIYNTLLKIYDIADRENISTAIAADKMAEQRIKDISNLSKIRKGL